MTVKFMWNGIKVDGTLYKAHYSIGGMNGGAWDKNTITIYGKNYIDLPAVEGLNIENDSDIMTDYFENDRIRVTPNNKYYGEVLAAYNKQNEHVEKRLAKRYAKHTA